MTEEEKEKLVGLMKHYEIKKNMANKLKESLLDQGIDGRIVFERARIREENFYYMIQNLSIILNDSESEFY